MASKKTIRKQKRDRQLRNRRSQRRSRRTLLALVLVGALIVIASALIFGTGGDRNGDLVWSPAHGHWHRR